MTCPFCHCPHDHEHPCHEPTVAELIERREWKALDHRFGLLEHRGQTIILYAMLKALLDREK